jgi:hypothetical protein
MQTDKEFYIISELSGFCIDVENSVKNKGSIVYLTDKSKSSRGQIWTYTKEGYLENKVDKKLCLDLYGFNISLGAAVTLWDKQDKKNQKWKIENGFIYSKINNYVIDIKNGSKKELAEVHMWSKHGKPSQK